MAGDDAGDERDSVAAPMARYPVSGKVALITGAMRGIGFETARLLRDVDAGS